MYNTHTSTQRRESNPWANATNSNANAAKERNGGLTLLIVGNLPSRPQLLHSGVAGLQKGTALAGLICAGLGVFALLRALPFAKIHSPKKEVHALAESRSSILTLSETATALDIDPTLAEKTLKALSKMGIATQRWQDYRKNVWEFPDYIQLPIAQTLDLAKKKGGRISLNDLVASGQSIETATQTLDTLSERKGLAQQDPHRHLPRLRHPQHAVAAFTRSSCGSRRVSPFTPVGR